MDWPRLDRPFIGAEVELLIMEVLDVLETDAAAHRDAQLAAARAEAAYRGRYAELALTADVKTESQRAAYGQFHARDLYETRREAEAAALACAETCRVRRAQLDALRSLVSSARAAEHG